MMSNISRVQKGLFRTPQSFTLLTTGHVLHKLRWDLDQLEEIRWNEDAGQIWRQVVSYKAIDCAISIWHMSEWIAQDLRGTLQRERACQVLGIGDHDPYFPIEQTQIRNAAQSKWPSLDICRIVATASKHNKVDRKPRPDIGTFAYLAMARRGNDSFMRPVIWLGVEVDGEKHDMVDVLRTGLIFWENTWNACQPESA